MLRKMRWLFKEIREIALHIALVVAALGMFVGIFVVIPATPGDSYVVSLPARDSSGEGLVALRTHNNVS